MNIKRVRALCEAKPGSTMDYPFGPEDRVYKVGGKVFAFLSEAAPWQVSLKCDPELARILRERCAAVKAPRYLNKQLWNLIQLDGSVPDEEIVELISHSSDLVVAKLPKALRTRLLDPAVPASSRGARAAKLPARNKRKAAGAQGRKQKPHSRRADR